MLLAEAFGGPRAQRTQQVWRSNLGRQTCCEGPGQAQTFAMVCARKPLMYGYLWVSAYLERYRCSRVGGIPDTPFDPFLLATTW